MAAVSPKRRAAGGAGWSPCWTGRLAEDVPSDHSPYFAPVQEPTLSAGTEAMITAALCWLGKD